MLSYRPVLLHTKSFIPEKLRMNAPSAKCVSIALTCCRFTCARISLVRPKESDIEKLLLKNKSRNQNYCINSRVGWYCVTIGFFFLSASETLHLFSDPPIVILYLNDFFYHFVMILIELVLNGHTLICIITFILIVFVLHNNIHTYCVCDWSPGSIEYM